MTAEALVAVREALHRLAAGLGIASDALAQAETVDQLSYCTERWPHARLAGLDPATIRAWVAAAPVQATLSQGDLDTLPLDAPDEAWAAFRDVTAGNPTLTLTLTLDKAALGADANTRVVLHPELLGRLWSDGPAAIEAAIPGELPVTIRVAAPGLALSGAGFAIGEAAPLRPPEADGWMARARPSLRWSDRWAERLSPADLLLDGTDPDDHLLTLARATAVQAAVRGLADAVTLDGSAPIALFVSQGVRVELSARFADPILPAAAAALVRLADWAFAAPFAPERLGVVRAVIADDLGPHAPADRGARLVADAARIESITHDRFQGFVDQRLDLWAAEVRRLDEEVVRAIAGYTDEVSAMVKDVSDTALAAVGVLVASIVASTARADPGLVLPAMLTAYAVYILVFPWWLRLGWHHERYVLVGERLDGVLERYRAVIGRARVEALLADRAALVQVAFVRWERRTRGAYAALIAVALAGALYAALR